MYSRVSSPSSSSHNQRLFLYTISAIFLICLILYLSSTPSSDSPSPSSSHSHRGHQHLHGSESHRSPSSNRLHVKNAHTFDTQEEDEGDADLNAAEERAVNGDAEADEGGGPDEEPEVDPEAEADAEVGDEEPGEEKKKKKKKRVSSISESEEEDSSDPKASILQPSGDGSVESNSALTDQLPSPTALSLFSSSETIHVIIFGSGSREEVDKIKIAATSILASRSTPLHFHFIISIEFQDSLRNWYSVFENECTLVTVYDVKGMDQLLDAFLEESRFTTDHYSARPTTSKMILHDFLPHLSAAVVIDSDLVFLRDVAHLWKNRRTDRQVGLICTPDPDMYHSFCQPGTCSQDLYCIGGVFVMNFDQMRKSSFRQLTVDAIRAVKDRYPNYNSQVADQDIWNILHAKHPTTDESDDVLYTLPCGWNCVFNQQQKTRPNMYPGCKNQLCGILHYNCAAYKQAANAAKAWMLGFWHGFKEIAPQQLVYSECPNDFKETGILS